MAIGRSKGPRVIAAGFVSRIEPRTKKDSDEVYAHDVTLDVGGGASVFVRLWDRDADYLPVVGRDWAAWAEVAVSAYNGRTDTSLNFDAAVTVDDLDRLASAMPAPAGK